MPETDKKPSPQVAPESSAENLAQINKLDDSESKLLNQEELKIINWLKDVRFQKQLFCGVNEEDVWKKIYRLNEMYMDALKTERIRYDVLLEEQNKIPIQSPNIVDQTKEIKTNGK